MWKVFIQREFCENTWMNDKHEFVELTFTSFLYSSEMEK